MTSHEDAPVLRVVQGDATPEEVAAILAVLTVRAGSREHSPSGPRRTPSRWADRSAALRSPIPTGPGAWVASAGPR